MQLNLKVGLFGIGLEAYWAQFEGLEKRLQNYISIVEDKFKSYQCEVVNLGLIDNPEKAIIAGHDFRKADVDIIFLYVTTYALSSTVLPVVQRAKVPVIILNLAPEASIDYAAFNAMTDPTKMTGEWLAYCSACPVPEIANVFKRAGIKFHQVTGMLHNDAERWNEIEEWIAAAKSQTRCFITAWVHGSVTLLSGVETQDGKLLLLVAEGESVAGPILEIGNTNSRYKFSIGVRKFVNDWNSHGPAHHCAVGVGHIASKIKKLAQLLEIDAVQCC